MKQITGWNKGLRMFQAIKSGHMLDIMEMVCYSLIADAEKKREFDGFTGNTQTSYSCGFYLNGKLAFIASSGDRMRKPVSKKIGKGKTLYLKNPYEGKPRKVTGRRDVDNLYGQQTAENFLKSYSGVPRKGYAIVMTTGTEYSEYIESERDLNVLTSTYLEARDLLLNHMKPIY